MLIEGYNILTMQAGSTPNWPLCAAEKAGYGVVLCMRHCVQRWGMVPT
jgi:hypothetical protein